MPTNHVKLSLYALAYVTVVKGTGITALPYFINGPPRLAPQRSSPFLSGFTYLVGAQPTKMIIIRSEKQEDNLFI
jgi:hypothetical protein